MDRPMTFGSLFAGIGGLDLGLERAGMTCKWQVEIDEYASQVLEKHWPNVPRWDDVCTFPPKVADWSVDLICGGFPCQDISLAGKGAGLAGERSGLFYELIRVVREVGPRIVLLENVSALLVRGINDVLGTLASIGYDAEWHCIPAAYVGAPHIRDRVFIIGCSNTQREGADRSSETRKPIVTSEVVQRIQQGWVNPSAQGQVSNPHPNGNRWSKATRIDGNQAQQGGESWRDSQRLCRWSSPPGVCRVVDGVPSVLDRLRGLGNAVVPQVAELIGRAIITNGGINEC